MVLMGVLENRKEYFFAFMGILFDRSKKKRSKCIVKSNHYVTQNICSVYWNILSISACFKIVRMGFPFGV